MTQPTTIQVSRETADLLKQLFPSFTFDQSIKAVTALAVDSGATSAHNTRTLPFRVPANPLTVVEQQRIGGVDGKIIGVIMHFPEGCAGLVEARVMLESDSLGEIPVFPSIDETFIALNAETTDQEDLDIKILKTEKIRVEWWNYDGANVHTVPVEVLVEKEIV
jgi:hypothetical protein